MYNLLIVGVGIIVSYLVYVSKVTYKVHDTGAILITGCSSGIGYHAAVDLTSNKNITVFAGVRKDSDVEKLKSLSIVNLVPIIISVDDHDSVTKAVELLKSELEARKIPLIALVNNAGVAYVLPVEFFPLDTARHLFNVNFFGLFDLTQQLLPLIRESQGRIVNIGSIAGTLASPLYGVYSASKFALEGWSDALRREVSEFGVSISLIKPAYVKTEIASKSYEYISNVVTTELRAKMTQTYSNVINDKTRQKAIKSINNGDDPIVTTVVIRDAIFSPKPRTRYLVANVNKLPAWVVSWIVWLLDDRLLDAILKSVG